MSHSRRTFLRRSLAAGAVLAVGSAATRGLGAFQGSSSGTGKRVLILGGTQFIGPSLVAQLQERGHHVTVFNRGRTEKRKGELPGDVERLVGDRDPKVGEGLKSLEGKTWDAVVDTSGYYPRHVKASAELLAKNTGLYVFVSSISAYKDNSKPGQDETAELATIADPTVETMGDQFENYGGLKVLCEQAVEAAMPGRTTIVRPGFIVGPGDPTDRFTYWPVRVAKGGEVLAPGSEGDPMQVIDVRDLAAFLITVVENKAIGTFNACGPGNALTMAHMLQACKEACPSGSPGGNATLTWVNTEFLHAYPEPLDTTIWIPPVGESAGFHRWSNVRAMKAGLKFKTIEQTAKDTLEWWPTEVERRVRVTEEMASEAAAKGEAAPQMADPKAIRAGMTAEQEAKALQAWHAKAAPPTSPANGHS